MRVQPAAAGGLFLLALPLAPGALSAQRVVTSTAIATFQTNTGTDSISSNTVQTAVLRPESNLQMTVIGALAARAGESIKYRIAYANTSPSVSNLGVAIVDTLPAGLEYISALPAAVVSGRVLRWTLGDISPNANNNIELTLRVSSNIRDTLVVRNVVYMTSANADGLVAMAEPVTLIAASALRALAVTQTAELLEVGLGESAPFTLVVHNTGPEALANIVVHGTLPDGGRYAKGSATGVDSTRVKGRELTLFVTGELGPGEKASVHFDMAVISASKATLTHSVFASADGDQVRSATAVASVRVRGRMSMEDRAVVGKVFVDVNDNGVQDAGERGVPDVEIWTDDGEIASTDADGRFSYRNLRPGHHGFRLDAKSVPAAFQLADAAAQELVTRDATGWTTPRVNFRLLPKGGRMSSVQLPALWSIKAYEQTLTKTIQAPVNQSVATPVVRTSAVKTTKGAKSTPAMVASRTLPVTTVVEQLVRFEAVFRNRYAVSLSNIELGFPVPLDSAFVLTGDSVLARVDGSRIALPAIPAGADVWIIGWAKRQSDSAAVTIARSGRVLDQASMLIAEPGPMVGRALPPEFRVDSLPNPEAVPVGSDVLVTIDPPSTGWRGEASFPAPTGWSVVPNSGDDTPTLGRDRSGSPMLFWHVGPDRRTPLVLRLRPAGTELRVEPARVATARTAEARAVEKQREFLDGPGVSIFAPADGQVLAIDRLFIGVRGQAGAMVALFDGDSLIERTTLRSDGVHDFIAVALKPGPHRLRASMQSSAGTERWDSVAVHVTGPPATFEADMKRLSMVADGNTVETMRVRVLDKWGIPVTNRPEVTVTAKGAVPLSVDVNASSTGIQLAPDEAGWLAVQLRPGHAVARGTLKLSWAKLNRELSFDVLPASQSLLIAGVGRVGVGASQASFGSLTARGQVGRGTSLVASYDSRRLDAGRNAFGRNADPLDQAQYPLLGDASAQRSTGASRYQLAARVERGYDWLALGDVSTSGFAGGLQLSGYRRALPGVAARFTTGAVVWQGFGSSTSQLLQQMNVRGAGMSGPYQLNRNVREGTEQVVLEIRAAENASRVLSRQVLERYVDYQIDYDFGILLFKQPVPALDTYGNPVFIVALYESDAGGPRSAVWGVRGSIDGNRWLRAPKLDSLRVGATWVNESQLAGGHRLLGADVRVMRFGALELAGEAAYSAGRDSSGVAASVIGGLTFLKGAAKLSATWQMAGREFANPANPSVQGGTEELRLGGEVKQGSHRLVLSHEWQQFGVLGLERRHSSASVVQDLGPKAQFESAVTSDRYTGLTTATASLGGEFKLQFKPRARWTLFTEGRRNFATGAQNLQPDYVGAGANVTVFRDLALELRHRQVFLPGDSAGAGRGYSVTDLGVRTRVGPGTEAYSKYQVAGIDGGRNAALVGMRSAWHLGTAGAFTTQFERRHGVGRALALDPVRALPFLQAEEDYWSVGVGADLTKPNAPYRLSGRAEYRDGALRSTQLATITGDVSFTRSLALLSRQEAMRNDQRIDGALIKGHRYSTLWGLAYRPVQSDALNLLGKAEWIDENRAGYGGVLTGQKSDGRAIAAAEAIWQPRRGMELGARYAFRQTIASLTASDGTKLRPRSSANFVGGRASVHVLPMVEVRADARLLHQPSSGSRSFDLAPAVAIVPQRTLEVVGGYRVGELRDPDFAVNGGKGWFVTFGARLTEGGIASAADFWRQRLGGR